MTAQIKAVATHRDELILQQKRSESAAQLSELPPAAE
jgi:DNA-directed RNA polymerase subunit beta'